MKRLLAASLFIALSLPLLAADECSDELPNQSDSEALAPAVAIGEVATAEHDGWRITLISVKRVASVNVLGKTKTPLGVYLAVEVQIENTAKERQALGGNRFKLVDSLGRNYTWYEAGTDGYGKKELGSRINPGLRAPAVILFDVPPDATALVLRSVGGVRIAIGDVASIR